MHVYTFSNTILHRDNKATEDRIICREYAAYDHAYKDIKGQLTMTCSSGDDNSRDAIQIPQITFLVRPMLHHERDFIG